MRVGCVRHVVAESVGEVCWVDAGVYPASYAVCDAESYVGGGAYARDEEGILSAVWARAFVFPAGADVVVGVEVEDVGVGVVASVFGCERGGYAVGEFGGGE